MRWVHITVIVLIAIVILVFAMQNLETVTMSFLGFSVSSRLAVFTVVIYVLGAVTGGSLFALLRRSIKGARARQ
jgi:uncharacterized integral membrane protein